MAVVAEAERPTTRRRARGEVPAMILRTLAASSPGARFTPYALAQLIEVSPGSATAAAKRLIDQDRVHCYGTSPLVIGAKQE